MIELISMGEHSRHPTRRCSTLTQQRPNGYTDQTAVRGGKGQVGKGGIVRDPELHRAACDRIERAVRVFGFETSLMDSPILGAEGNKEFLLHARH